MKFGIIGPKHIYNTPHHGRVDLRYPLSDDKALALFIEPSFPYLKLTKASVDLLKSEKIDTIISILPQLSFEELDLIKDFSKSKKFISAIEKRITELTPEPKE